MSTDLEQTKDLLSAKNEEVRELKQNKRILEQTQSQLKPEESRKIQRLNLQADIRTLQQDDEQRQVEWKLKMQKEFDSERQTWFSQKEESLQRRFAVEHDVLLTKENLQGQVEELKSTLVESQTNAVVRVSLSKYALTDQMLEEAKSKVVEQSTHWEQHYKEEFERLRTDVHEEYEDINQQLDVRESELMTKRLLGLRHETHGRRNGSFGRSQRSIKQRNRVT